MISKIRKSRKSIDLRDFFYLRIYSQKQRISDNIDSPLSFPAKLGEFDVITSDLLFGNEAFYIAYLFC